MESDFATFLSAAPKVREKWCHYHHCTLWTLCNSLLGVWNVKYKNHRPLMCVLSLAKIKNSINKLQSYQFNMCSRHRTIPFTFRICFPAYSLVLLVVSRKNISWGAYSLLCCCSGLSSTVLWLICSQWFLSPVIAYYRCSTLPWILLLHSLQISVFTVSKMTPQYGRQGRLSDACPVHEFVKSLRAVFDWLMCLSHLIGWWDPRFCSLIAAPILFFFMD